MTPPGQIRQGEVREFTQHGNRVRVIVLSRDEISNGGLPIVVPLVRGADDIPPLVIAMGESDPVSGEARVVELSAVNPDTLGEPVALVGGATMNRLLAAVHDLFEE